jgi:hypothetical protein
MLITEATAMLAPYGVERIEMSTHTANLPGTPVWAVFAHGKRYSYCCRLDQLVQVLMPEQD